jgi:hypothetical protein
MPTVDGRPLAHDELGGLLDLPVLVDDRRRSDRRVAYLNPDSAARAGRPLTELTPAGLWTALRELSPGEGLVVDPDGPEILDFSADEVDGVLGAPRADSSTLSWRRRADLASRWVLFHKDPQGRPLSPVQNDFGQRFAFAWTDQQAATAALQPGNSLVQVPLVIALRSNPGVTVLLDAGAPEQVVIDEPLSAQIIAAAEYFPRDYLAFVAVLVPQEEASYVPAARAIVEGVRALGLPVRSAKIVGYRLERARSQVIVVLDTDAGAGWDAALGAIPRMVPQGLRSPDAVLRRGDISETFHPMIDAAPERAEP